MTDARLQTLIEKAFEERAKITPQTKGDVRGAVETALDLLDLLLCEDLEDVFSQGLDVALFDRVLR